jgi:methylmalonyl-CoA/ethylmalonyl-CoA epimerase
MKVDHIAIAVKNIDDVRELWAKLLKIDTPEIHTLKERGVHACAYRLDNLMIELVQPIDESSPIWKFVHEKGGGLHHVALQTADIDSEIEYGKSNGFKFIGDKAVEGLDKTKIIFLHPKTLGTLVELVQPKE